MIVDARQGSERASLDCDLCIVGAGAAGLTLALQLGRSRLSICVLEAGGLDYDGTPQSMLAGETGESDYPPLHTARVAGLGGSMRVWAGWCRPLDEIDFEQREAIPHSGWPFGLDEMKPYYAQAHEKLDLGPFDYDPAAWEKISGTQRLPLAGEDLSSVLFRQCPLNLGVSLRAALGRLQNVRVLLHANVMRLSFSQDGKAVRAIEVATLNGKRFDVRPRTVVLAAGGIETARLLLLSAEGSRGPGNENGLVGRYFTEHGYDNSALYVPADSRRSLHFYFAKAVAGNDKRHVVRGGFAPAAARMRREGLLNCGTYFRPAYEAHPAFEDPRVQAALELWDMLRSRAVPDRRLAKAIYAASAPHSLLLALWCRFSDRGETIARLPVCSLFECAPDPDNRIVLGATRDALGRRVARVQWRMRDLDLRSVARTHELLDASLRSAGLGRLQLRASVHDAGWPRAPGKHHLGTTRMHRDPAKGVVDANARVHGVDNLFISGGSVFTTGGFANPTLTVVALALRLAAHLHRHLNRLH
jgi:choline dehydrogenase-like flavoprotein